MGFGANKTHIEMIKKARLEECISETFIMVVQKIMERIRSVKRY